MPIGEPANNTWIILSVSCQTNEDHTIIIPENVLFAKEKPTKRSTASEPHKALTDLCNYWRKKWKN